MEKCVFIAKGRSTLARPATESFMDMVQGLAGSRDLSQVLVRNIILHNNPI